MLRPGTFSRFGTLPAKLAPCLYSSIVLEEAPCHPTTFLTLSSAEHHQFSVIEIFDGRECPLTKCFIIFSTPGADDNLRVSRAKKKQEGITQGMADRCVQEEIADFLGGILSQSAAGNQGNTQIVVFA